MILFYDKKTGEVFSAIDGRVHDEMQLNSCVSDSTREETGKYIIGWIEKDGKKIEYNLDKFDILQRFEDTSQFSPLDCKIIDGNLRISVKDDPVL